ncbi:hypothetical protein [Streptomyces sp. NPDC048172]|uniref:hypothetical protein n=1 Tax=Streptomyces sp. NPDC048172 TaxID=3365505 RepID=UPI0037206DC5
MAFVRTTPPRPVDPRPGTPSAGESSVGGPLLWPVEEPWPHCEGAHLHRDSGFRRSPAEVRLERRVRARLHRDPRGPAFTPEEEAVRDRNAAVLGERRDAGPPWPAECPVPMLPVAQLYLRDIPLLRPPGQSDLLQILWCPYDHAPDYKPSTALFWRSAAAVADTLATPPEPYEADYPGYVPEPCLLAPEAITEYPHSLDLSPELQLAVGDWSRWQAADVGVDSSYADCPEEFYDGSLADAPGWKVGGWPPWDRTDPYRLNCTVCDARMVPLLTIASFEWDGGEPRGWVPYEDQAAAGGSRAGQDPAQPTRVEVGSTDNVQLYVCPASPGHPHTDLVQ